MQNFSAEYNQEPVNELPRSNDFAYLNFGRIDQTMSAAPQFDRFSQQFSPYLPNLEIQNRSAPFQQMSPQDYGSWFRNSPDMNFHSQFQSGYPPGYWDSYWRHYFQNYYGNTRQEQYPQQHPQQYERQGRYRPNQSQVPSEQYEPYERPNNRERPERRNERSNLNFSLEGKTIALVPGHGGHDHGNTAGGTSEKKTALEISLRLKATLESLGAKVVISREEDVLVAPSKQKSFVESQRPDVAIAIHTDSAGARDFGNMTLWGLPISRQFAETMQSVLSKVTESNRPVKQQTTTWKGERLAIVHAQDVPTILLETANMKNSADAQRIQTADYQQRLVDGIARGVHEYFSSNSRSARR